MRRIQLAKKYRFARAQFGLWLMGKRGRKTQATVTEIAAKSLPPGDSLPSHWYQRIETGARGNVAQWEIAALAAGLGADEEEVRGEARKAGY